MAGRKSRSFTKPASAPNSEINVTPLVDVVLVLLIIFMVMTPLLEKDIEVRVPETETEQPEDPSVNDQLVVQIDEAGEFSINTEKITVADYTSRLKRMLAAKPKDEKIVFFMANDKASYGKLIVALDGAKAAGAKVLGFATELPQGAVVPGGATPVDTGTAPAPTP